MLHVLHVLAVVYLTLTDPLRIQPCGVTRYRTKPDQTGNTFGEKKSRYAGDKKRNRTANKRQPHNIRSSAGYARKAVQ